MDPAPSERLRALLWLRSATKSWVATFLRQVFCGLRGLSPSPRSSQGNALLRPSLCQLAVSEGCVSSGNRRSSQHPPWEGWLAFSPLSPLRKGRKPSKPQPSALAGPPLLPACFLKGCRLSLQVAGAGFPKDVQGLTPQNRTAPGLGGGHRFNWIYGEFGTLDGRLQGLKAQ